MQSARADGRLRRQVETRAAGSGNLRLRAVGLDHQLRGSTAIRRTDLDGDHGERRSTACPTADECEAADALVTTGRASDVKVRTAVINATFERDHVTAERLTAAVRKAIEACGADLWLLPPYSQI